MYSLKEIIEKEETMQKECLLLTPSENIPSHGVRECLSSVLINRYCEGYPGKRYYMGQKYIDLIENQCIELAKKAFNSDGYEVNVQALSGAIANLGSYFSILPNGGKILAMNLSSGGHLSHGSKPSMTSKLFEFFHYHLDNNEKIDMNEVESLAKKHKPDLIVCGASSYPDIIDFASFAKIAKMVGAKLLADISHISGLIIAGHHPTPFGYADIIMTTTHKTLRGPKGALIFFKNEYQKDFNKTIFPGMQGGVNLGSVLGITRALEEALTDSYKNYIKNVIETSAYLADLLLKENLKLFSKGTKNHLMIIKLDKPIARQRAFQFEEMGIIVNPNSIQSDISPFKPSGIRLGTPLICSRGMKKDDMKEISSFLVRALIIAENDREEEKMKLKNDIKNFTSHFPVLPKININ